MLQATNAHIRRLFNEKMQSEEELLDCRERVKKNIGKVIEQRKFVWIDMEIISINIPGNGLKSVINLSLVPCLFHITVLYFQILQR